MKILTVVGARPQFIKMAMVSRKLRQMCEEILVHTGQHYDYNMSDVFFEELEIPRPDYNLGIAGGGHGHMTGRMLEALEEVIQKEQPDMVLVYGDTNSTLAGALAAVKLQIPVSHVEAGNRLGTLDNPEEVNRICTDHISEKLFACTESAMISLRSEGLSDRAELVGDPMYDAFLYYAERVSKEHGSTLTDVYGNPVTRPEKFYYLTCHRQENTDADNKLIEILQAMNGLQVPTIYPVHPRNREKAIRICKEHNFDQILLVLPVSYLTSISLVNGAEKIVTDSGGLQREAFFAQKQCVTVFDHVMWPETMVDGRNQLAKPNAEQIRNLLLGSQIIRPDYQPFGDGHSAERIVNLLTR